MGRTFLGRWLTRLRVIGNDGLTTWERRAYAARWRAGAGRKPTAHEMAEMREFARASRAARSLAETEEIAMR